jgi:hypothetical protein
LKLEKERRVTLRMRAENVAYRFGVVADSFDSRDEVAAVALKKDAVFRPVVVYVVFVPDFLQLWVAFGLWVENEPVDC